MPDEKEKVPFNMATGELQKPEDVKKPEETKTDTPTEEKTEVPAEQTATKTEAAAAGTTVDAVDAFFKSEMADKYGIKDKDELFGILETINDLKAERDQLKGRTSEPVFKNDKQKNIYNFLQEYENLGDGMETVARLGTIDPMNMDGNAALKEAYILENKDLTREQAGRMWDKKESKKYENTKQKEDYDDPIDFDDENEMLKIQKERDINKARRTLVQKKEELKTQATVKEVKEDPAIPPQALNRYSKEVDRFFDTFHTLKVANDDGSNEVSLKFSPEQLKELKNAAKVHINNPSVYSDGEIKDFDILKLANTFAWAFFNEQMSQLMLKQVKTIAHITKAEEIAQKTPDKKSGSDGGEGATDKTFWGQAEAAAKKKAEERKTNPMKRTPLPAG